MPASNAILCPCRYADVGPGVCTVNQTDTLEVHSAKNESPAAYKAFGSNWTHCRGACDEVDGCVAFDFGVHDSTSCQLHLSTKGDGKDTHDAQLHNAIRLEEATPPGFSFSCGACRYDANATFDWPALRGKGQFRLHCVPACTRSLVRCGRS